MDESWCGQAQNGVNFDFEIKFHLEGQDRLPQKTLRALTNDFCIFRLNLASLAWTVPRAIEWTNLVTDGRTDTGNDNTQRPKLASGKNEKMWTKFS